ncbi:MAG: hypothetical protein JWP25_3801, partial [Bradyrhizobium sp.]|nr:hypothetical protein [Bradyrhizobium sp.]
AGSTGPDLRIICCLKRPAGSRRRVFFHRSRRKGRYAPLVHMIRLTEQRQTVPYVWMHPDEER